VVGAPLRERHAPEGSARGAQLLRPPVFPGQRAGGAAVA
jgi:hypothetical protein